MIKKQTGNLILLLTALIWGSSFVAQTTGMEHVQPFTFMGIRTVLGGLVLIPVILFQRRMQSKAQRRAPEVQRHIDRMSLIGGICCGLVLCIAGDLQQFGMTTTSPGKAGFITSLYIVIVPLLGIFIGKKIPKIVWFCVAAALFGFYLLCVTEQFTISTGDLLVLCCAFFFSIHIMVIDHFSEKGIDGVLMCTVSCRWRHQPDCDVCLGIADMGAYFRRAFLYFIQRRDVVRRCLYTADSRSKAHGSDFRHPADELGICLCRPVRLADSAPELFSARISRLCFGLCRCAVVTDSPAAKEYSHAKNQHGMIHAGFFSLIFNVLLLILPRVCD